MPIYIQTIQLEAIDIFELRLDKWPFLLDHKHTQSIVALSKPLIITPRDVSEGGARKDWKFKDRHDLFFKFMPYATLIDIEASTANSFGHVIKEAHLGGVGVIVSYHNFDETPSYAEIICQAEICRRSRGDVLKIAVKAGDYGDLAELYDAVHTITVTMKDRFPFKVSVMVMGEPFGQVSRFTDAFMGGPFVYSCLSGASVPGQPKASEVKQLLAKLR